jgi:WD40 repeat protein
MDPLQHFSLDDRHDCMWVGTAVDISPDGKMALIGSSEEWRIMSQRLRKGIPGDSVQGFITNALQDTIGISMHGDTLYGSVRLSSEIWRFTINIDRSGPTPVTQIDTVFKHTIHFSPNYFNVSLWDLEKKRSVRVFPTFIQQWHPVSAVRFSPDSRLAIALVLDKAMEKPDGRDVYLKNKLMGWHIHNGLELKNPFGKNAFHAISFENAPARAAIIGPDNTASGAIPIGSVVTECTLSDGQIRREYLHDTLVRAVALHPNGQITCTLTEDGVLTEWDANTGAKLRQLKEVPSSEYLAYAPDPDFLVIGQGVKSIWNLNTGKPVLKLGNYDGYTGDLFFEGHSPGQVSQFKFLPNGQHAISTTYDGTIQYWDYKSGTELFTCFFPGKKGWVVTTPSGLFDASAGALEAMYFSLGTEIIEMGQLKERYYEPGLLQKLMGFSEEPLRSVEGFDSIALYPLVRLQLDTFKNNLTIRLQPRNGGVGKVSVFVNGKEIIEDANPPQGFEKIRDTTFSIDLAKYARYFLFDTLNIVSVRAYNAADWLKSSPKSVVYQPVFARSKGSNQTTGASTLQPFRRYPKLYVLAVGTHKFANEQLNLKYSAKDARDISEALCQVGEQLFGVDSVDLRLLTTDTLDHTLVPTKANIQAAFEQIKNEAKAEDILAVYFSGHGVSYGDADKALFYYLTTAVYSDNLSDVDYRNSTTISSAELTRWLKSIPASKQLLILDACNSGRVVENLAVGQKALSSGQIRALDRMKDRTGMFVLTGSAADKVSFEAGEYSQGLLTYSLLEGMKGMALTTDTTVDVSMLFEYACNRVPELAQGIGGVQKPMLVGPTKGSFEIGLKNEAVQIPLEQGKPVFIRCYFQDSLLYNDVLGLTGAMKDYFQEETRYPEQAALIYMDVASYDSGYSIRGRYRREGELVYVRGRLFRGEKLVGNEFRVTGKKDKLPRLVEAILEAVWQDVSVKRDE